ncbi:hypothetical protein CDL15_Pgr018901 [Punica granatum]|uniref:Homeobox-DDT domain protein RLT3 n=1 Tax=Punica granatum TaxID=22663 RepID=A0A218WNM9_PUNGR|nr:hypothetical protein CDL15_Pgr018901 [Punica granatum]
MTVLLPGASEELLSQSCADTGSEFAAAATGSFALPHVLMLSPWEAGSMVTKRKTPLQVQALEDFYSDDKCPTPRAMEEYAVALGLTLKQVQQWFSEKRRRDKKGNEIDSLPCSSKEALVSRRKDRRIAKAKRLKRPICLQDMLFTPEYIMQKVFRKDGPPLGIEFDSLPARAFNSNAGSCEDLAFHETLHKTRKRKKQRRLRDKLLEKKKPIRKKKKRNQDSFLKPPPKEKCKLALESVTTQEHVDLFAVRVDDEELELRESRTGPNPLSSCDHLASDALRGCSLCKDLLPKFPPISVKMKKPFSIQPWDSSLEMVKKLFKAFHFLYTYSVMLDINSFTLDEFAQAFHDKDSLLLGKIHVALLELLFVDIDLELSGGPLHHSSKSCKFLALIHSVENQEIVVEFWKKFLNPLTWPEVLRQVSVAAGFGSNQGSLQREVIDEELNRMRKYGLHPGTLKGELFRLLLQQGNNGLKVSEMARSPQIAELNISSTTEELENSICSSLSSDIALFEKISSSTYRLRVNFGSKDDGDCHSDTEDSGTIDDQHDESGLCSSGNNSECESESPSYRKSKHMNHYKRRNSMLFVNGEIDESNPGEPWLLGLMEGEYSDLSIEEKLNALEALIDLLRAGSSIRMEDPTIAMAENAAPAIYCGSGGKIKRPSANQWNVTRPSWVYESNRGGRTNQSSHETHPVDSKEVMSKLCTSGKTLGSRKGTDLAEDIHPMQSVFLGSDRRYNRYWLFLGPCDEYDPGHKRVYFESSEDGHWEVIDTEEAFCALLSVLDERGAREGPLIDSLDKRKVFICQAMLTGVKHTEVMSVSSSCQSELDMGTEANSSPISDVDNCLNLTVAIGDSMPLPGAIVLENGKKTEEQKRRWSRLKAFDAWTWNTYLELNCVKLGKRSFIDSLVKCERCHDLYWRDEKHCKICHTTFELDFELEERYAIHAATCTEKDVNVFPKHKILSSRLQSLKAAVHTIESIMPEGSLIGAWSKSAHRLWVKRLRRTSTVAELLQVLADFVGAINRDWLFQCDSMRNLDIVGAEMVALFPMIPQTSSAVALWLVKLDVLLANYIQGANSNRNQQ